MARLSIALLIAITALLLGSSASAATYQYSFQENVVVFPFSPTDKGQNVTELLATPYATLVVTDVTGGIDMSVRINAGFAGWLNTISFNYISELGFGMIKSTSPTAGKPYYYSDPDGVSGFGTGYSFPKWVPESTFLTFLYGNPFGQSLDIHLRNLPYGVGAQSFAPQYVSVTGATGWGKTGGYNPSAYVLSNPVAAVPEPEEFGMMMVGLGVLGAKIRRRRQVTRP
jgi:hypothetical protein